MNRRNIMYGIGALAMLALLVASCTTTLTTTVRTTQSTTLATTMTQGTTAVVPTTITVGTGVFPEPIDFGYIGQGTFIISGKTTVLLPTGTLLRSNATVTAEYGTFTLVTTLSGIPPVIPHAASVEGFYGTCFNCHQIPAGHTGRIANQQLCGDCHQQGPVLLPE